MPTEVIVFCDVCDAAKVGEALAARSDAFNVTIIPLQNGPDLAKVVRQTFCSRRSISDAFCCVNWCSGNDESEDRANTSTVAELIEKIYKVPLIGNPLAVTKYDVEDIRMLMFYSELRCPNFCIVKGQKDLARLEGIHCPASVWVGDNCSNAASSTILAASVAHALQSQPVVLVVEDSLASTHSLTVIVSQGKVYHTPKLIPLEGVTSSITKEPDASTVAEFVATVVTSIMGKQGHARIEVHVDNDGTLALTDVKFNISLPIAAAGIAATEYFAKEVPVALAMAEASAPKHIVSFDPVGKGYFMRAARDIAEGELVFEDERRAFAIVTRDHVVKTWSDADKYTFSRYAWPLDADCHVYAIWEDDPKRWRPINHSCDPNLVFAEGHSLNVIARRSIKEQEDLTLDYSTFCDYTMKPFQCFCNSDKCRGTVTPGQVPWETYGSHAWHRREPPKVADLVPSQQ